MSFVVPEPRAVFDAVMDDAALIRVRQHGNPRGTRLFMSHGNGFAIDAYWPYWSLLLDRCELVIFDFRNHGHNAVSDPANHHYAQMARDLASVYAQVSEWLGPKPGVGVFHSMSGRAAMKHAVEIGFPWAGLVLYDPPNVPPPGHPMYEPMCAFETRLADWARGRRERFEEPSELGQEYARSRANSRWVDGAHELMARSVLRRDTAGGGWVLRCPPELESSIYAQALTLNLWPRVEEYGGPVRLVGADPDLPGTPPTGAANRALGTEYGYDYLAVAGTGHLLQIEKPRECVAALTGFLAKLGLAA